MKKVFMVSDVVRCLLRRRDQITARVEAYNSTLKTVDEGTFDNENVFEGQCPKVVDEKLTSEQPIERDMIMTTATPPPPPLITAPTSTHNSPSSSPSTSSSIAVAVVARTAAEYLQKSSALSSSANPTSLNSTDFDSWPEVDKTCLNLRSVWEAYAINGADFNKIEDHLVDANVSSWMSGLVCCTSEECATAYTIIMDENGPGMEEDPILQQVSCRYLLCRSVYTRMLIPILRFYQIRNRASNAECPPGCGCDNPW